jgi:hypothetical protein
VVVHEEDVETILPDPGEGFLWICGGAHLPPLGDRHGLQGVEDAPIVVQSAEIEAHDASSPLSPKNKRGKSTATAAPPSASLLPYSRVPPCSRTTSSGGR